MTKKKPSGANSADALRARAEQLLATRGIKLENLSLADTQQLVHKLQVYQVELELQNEELLRAQESMAKVRDRYADLYDFAPVGYFTLDEKGLVIEANLTGARLVGREMRRLLKTPFLRLVAPADRPLFQSHLKDVFSSAPKQTCELKLETKDDKPLYVALESVAAPGEGESELHCRTIMSDITARKQAKAALSKNSELEGTVQQLEQSRNTLQAIIESIPIRVFWKDRGLRYMGCNTLFARDAGCEHPEQLLGQDDFAMGWRDQADLYRADDRQVIESCRSKLNIIEPQTTPAGGKIWLDTSKVPLQKPNGEVFGVLGIYEDITVRKATEEVIKLTQERLELAIKGADLGTWDWNLKTGALALNDRWAEMLGYRPDEVEPHYHSWENLAHPEDLPATMSVLNAHLAGKTPLYETEHRLRHKSGEWVWVLDRGKVIERDAQGQPLRACGTHLDITARKQAEAELQFRNVILSTQQEVSIDGILVVDEKARILSYNRRFIEMWGLPAKLVEDKVDEPVLQFVTAQMADPHSFFQRVQHLFAHRRETSRDELLLADGRVFDRYSAPMFGPEERYYGRVWYFRDITERKQAEAEIIRQREELRGLAARLAEVEEAERQELARELHDQVCQNLTSLSITLETLILRAQKEPLDQLLSRVANLAALVEQTSEITRDIMEGLRPTVLDHYGLMGGLRQLASQFSQRTGIAAEVRGEESAPRLATLVELALFRITQEALANMAKHSRGSQVTVACEEKDDTFRLTIADNGIGFDPDKVPPPTAGHKWGLVTMAERTLAIGGHYCIESQSGQGTRVVVEVPR
jgi:PAS domain S-box-containing protein